MALLGLLLSAYFILLLTRALVPDTGQMAFNRPYRLVVRLTEPAVAFSARLLPQRLRRLGALPAIGFVILLQGVILMGAAGPGAGVFTWGFTEWNFAVGRPFWGLGAALARYLVLSYRVFAFLLLVVLVSPDAAASDQFSRLFRAVLQPVFAISRDRRVSAALLPLIFAVGMLAFRRIYLVVGWLGVGEGNLGQTLANSLYIPLQLATVIVYLIFFRALLSWFARSPGMSGPLFWLESFVEPFLRPFRRFNLVLGSIDLTPLAAILAILILRRVAGVLLFELYRLF